MADNTSDKEEQGVTTRSDWISRPHNKVKEYPGVYHFIQSKHESKPTNKSNQYTSSYYSKGKVTDGRCLHPYYTDDNYKQHLTNGDYHNIQYFIEDVNKIIFIQTKQVELLKWLKRSKNIKIILM